MKPVFAIGLAVAALGLGAVAIWAFPSDESKFLAACEAGIKERLRSPSSYVAAGLVKAPRRQADLNDFLGEASPDVREWRNSQRAGKSDAAKALRDVRAAQAKGFKTGDYQVVSYLISYDAANGFGAMIRGVSECSQVVKAGGEIEAPSFLNDPVIDGVEASDWAFYQLWLAKNGNP